MSHWNWKKKDIYQTAYEILKFPEFSSVGPPCSGLCRVSKNIPQDLAGISSLNEDSAVLAPWDICSLGDERVDGVSDELAAIKEVIITTIRHFNDSILISERLHQKKLLISFNEWLISLCKVQADHDGLRQDCVEFNLGVQQSCPFAMPSLPNFHPGRQRNNQIKVKPPWSPFSHR